MARTSIATDNFNRASIGANWAQLNTGNAGDIGINSSVKFTGQYGLQPTGNLATVRWVGAGTFTNDQYSSAVILNKSANAGTSTVIGVICRAGSGTGASRNYYEVTVDCETTPTTSLVKWVSGTRTVLYSSTTPTWADNDRVELECEGTTVRVMKNGTALGGSYTVTDSSLTTGAPGISSTAGYYGDDWDGGNLGSGSPTTPPLAMHHFKMMRG